MGKKINGEINIIPEELIEEILHKLPVKSLLRFECVSKSWRSLISDKAFIKNHLKKPIANGENTDCNKLLFSFMDRTTKLVRLGSCSLRNEPIITPDFNFDDHSIPWGGMSFSVVGSCNGLILVDTRDALFIWNPSTRRVIKEFKPPFFDYRSILLDSPYGLGYDESTGDYKVVCTHNYKTHMYSCNTNSWKEIQTRSDQCFWAPKVKFVNGRFHWLAGGGIVSLRLSDEKFENELIIPGPTQYQSDRPAIVRVEDFGGYLSLYCREIGNVNVWAMMKYGVTESWTKVWTLSDPELLMYKGLAYPLCLKKNGDITVAFRSGDIVVYNGKQELRKYRVHMLDAGLNFVVYVESLVFIS